MTDEATSYGAEVAVSTGQPKWLSTSAALVVDIKKAKDVVFDIMRKRGGGGSVTSAAKCAVPGHLNSCYGRKKCFLDKEILIIILRFAAERLLGWLQYHQTEKLQIDG